MRNLFFRQRATFSLPLTLTLFLLSLRGALPVVASELSSVYLHGGGSDSQALFLDAAPPTATAAKFKDSAGVTFSGGNPWKEIGTWTASPALLFGSVVGLDGLHVFVGLKNGDDQGARFDLRGEVYKNGAPMTSGENLCVAGVIRNPDKAQEVIIAFKAFPEDTLAPSDILSLTIRTRVGTTATGAFCGGHVSAIGLRLYFDAVTRPSRFGATTIATDWNTGVGGTSDRAGLSRAVGPSAPSVAWTIGPSGNPSPPVIEGDLVVFPTPYGVIEAHDLNTGAQRWTATVPTVFPDVRVSAMRGAQVYVTRGDGANPDYVFSLDAANGSILWRSQDLIGESPGETAAFAANEDLIVGSFYWLSRINHVNGETVWKTPRQCQGNGSCMASVFGNRVYAWDMFGAADVVSVFDATSGAKLYSSAGLGYGGSQSGLVVGPNSTVYAPLNSNGPADAFIALHDTGSALIEAWRIPMGWTPFASFGIGPDGSVYTYSPGHEILRLDPATGAARNTSMPIPFDAVALFPRMAIDHSGRVFLTNGGHDLGQLFSFNANLTFRWSDSVPYVLGGPALANNGTLVVCSLRDVRAYKAGGTDWSTGVGGTSDRAGLSRAVGPTTPSILWQAGIPAAFGEQSVTEGSTVVSTRSAFEADGSWIVAQDLEGGGKLWRVKLPISFADSDRGHVSAIRGGQVYATRTGFGNLNREYLYALNAANGSVLWRSQDLMDEENYAESLAFTANGDPIVGNWRSLTRINHVDGTTVWTAARQCPVGSGCMATVSGNHVYASDIINPDVVVSVFDATTGNRLYSSSAVNPGQSALLVGPDGTVYVPGGDSSGAVFIALLDTGSALIEKWRIPMASTAFASFGIGADGSVYTYSRDNRILRLDPATGVVRNASVSISSSGQFYGPRMAIDSAGRVFLTADAATGGAVYSFNADLTLRWSDSIPLVNLGGPAIGRDGTLVVCGADYVRAYRTSP